MIPFSELGLQESLLKAIEDLGFETPSEVQEKAIPLLLADHIDLVALAQTGTGKTAAFGFPLIQRIDPSSRTTQGLILSPTRELCLQITKEIQAYSKYERGLNTVAIYGGASIQDQARQIQRGAQIVVATPGRMKDMISRGMVDISKIDYCILDEADEMLNMGFFEDIKDILSNTPKEKATWLFSATMPKEVAIIAKKFMNSPQEITVGTKNSGATTVQHEYYVAGGRDRYPVLKRLADTNPNIFSVIFCRTKRDTQKVAENLIEDGYNAGALHGDLSQNQRDLVMNAFRKKQIQMLVATDVAARGIDVDDITHVINYQLPDEIETYNHRSGRTGRAGKSGTSMVIITRSEMRKIKAIENKIQKKFIAKPIPTGMEICETQLYHLVNKIKDTEVNADVENYLPAINEMLEGIDKDTLVQKIVSVEFGRFFNYYNKAKDLNSNDRDRGERPERGERRDSGDSRDRGASKNYGGDGSTRYFINIGEKDGYDWMSLKDFLRDTVNLGKDDIFKVDVKESFSFFNSEANVEEAILNTFKDLKVDGRFVNVEVSNNPIGGGSSRGGGGFKGRSKGGSGGGSGFRSKERGGYKGGGSSRSDRPSRSTSSDRSDSGRRGSGDGGKSFGGSPFSENKKSKRRNGFM
ncbi:MAG: DEAD/DEAH box helicase [Flavobacteriaceae bacterium]|jgi:ATP-dependent RNA helicase DeaD|nr:DEAD/DEAH box helicase [Flavobacteriaceae bacterium]MBT5394669.1 DEAD/DEAH box helicase [Flavobacteriaceae bacterium]MBT5586332.1 DEAD/DEAH box helicase [Flavobacteriaceae bacterium]MBT7239925.1 DEAD/DEAH box helicase [Flavobacteriaceae bacterium]MCO4779569.1 DEAD/DEAH box helicase [Flavobacteriaceae bacterium]|tara:strand:- start:1022 stop:2935 length:1914 start_codon:yes stop_codon:yes gene_type:complete